MSELSLTQMSTEEQIALLYKVYPALFRDQVSPETLKHLKLDFLEYMLGAIENAYNTRGENNTYKTIDRLIKEVSSLNDNPLLPPYIANLVSSYEGGIDGLTRLMNQGMYHSDLEKEVARADRNIEDPTNKKQEISLILIDLDHMKMINDENGHSYANKVLKAVADTIKCSLRRRTDTAYRIGGDEFAVILPDTDEYGAYEVARRILEGAHALEIDGNPFRLGLSIGVAQLEQGESAGKFYDYTDRALYLAKQSGKDCIVTASKYCQAAHVH